MPNCADAGDGFISSHKMERAPGITLTAVHSSIELREDGSAWYKSTCQLVWNEGHVWTRHGGKQTCKGELGPKYSHRKVFLCLTM